MLAVLFNELHTGYQEPLVVTESDIPAIRSGIRALVGRDISNTPVCLRGQQSQLGSVLREFESSHPQVKRSKSAWKAC